MRIQFIAFFFRCVIWVAIGLAAYFVVVVIFYMIEPTLMPAVCKALGHFGVRAEGPACFIPRVQD